MALNDTMMSTQDAQLLKSYGDAYNKAKAAGDSAGMKTAHENAETLRRSYGYTGGSDGGSYSRLSASSGNGYIDKLYDAQQDAAVNALANAYEANLMTLNQSASKIPETYDASRNQAAAQSEINRAAWNEYAAGRGLTTGAGGQAELARRNELQRNLSDISKSEAAALSEIEAQKALLATQYKNSIATAISEGDFERAQALYNDAQQKADTMAGYGEFSRYKDLGYTDAEIAAMKRAWDESQSFNSGGSSYSGSGGGYSSSSDSSSESEPTLPASETRRKDTGQTFFVSGLGYVTQRVLSEGLKNGQIRTDGGFEYVY